MKWTKLLASIAGWLGGGVPCVNLSLSNSDILSAAEDQSMVWLVGGSDLAEVEGHRSKPCIIHRVYIYMSLRIRLILPKCWFEDANLSWGDVTFAVGPTGVC